MKKIIIFWCIGLTGIVISSLFQNLAAGLVSVFMFFIGLYFLVKDMIENEYTYRMKQTKNRLKENQYILGIITGVVISIFVNSMYRLMERLEIGKAVTVDILTMIFAGLTIIFLIWFLSKIQKF